MQGFTNALFFSVWSSSSSRCWHVDATSFFIYRLLSTCHWIIKEIYASPYLHRAHKHSCALMVLFCILINRIRRKTKNFFNIKRVSRTQTSYNLIKLIVLESKERTVILTCLLQVWCSVDLRSDGKHHSTLKHGDLTIWSKHYSIMQKLEVNESKKCLASRKMYQFCVILTYRYIDPYFVSNFLYLSLIYH